MRVLYFQHRRPNTTPDTTSRFISQCYTKQGCPAVEETTRILWPNKHCLISAMVHCKGGRRILVVWIACHRHITDQMHTTTVSSANSTATFRSVKKKPSASQSTRVDIFQGYHMKPFISLMRLYFPIQEMVKGKGDVVLPNCQPLSRRRACGLYLEFLSKLLQQRRQFRVGILVGDAPLSRGKWM